MMTQSAIYVVPTTPTNGVRVLAFNRPEKRNALSHALIQQLLDELKIASDDTAVKAIIITGTNGVFSAGADINDIAYLDAARAMKSRYLEDLCHGLAGVRKPLIAAVEGIALGGGFEVALMCDVIFASESSRFGLPEVSIGIIPGAGGTQRLTNIVGKFRAMQIILLGTKISAHEAKDYGLVAEVASDGHTLQAAISAASQLASKSPVALALAKEAISRSDELGRDDRLEKHLYYLAFGTDDKREGIAAFLEKREAKWEGL